MQVISKNNHAQLSTIDEIKHAPASVELAPLAVTAFAEPLVPLRATMWSVLWSPVLKRVP